MADRRERAVTWHRDREWRRRARSARRGPRAPRERQRDQECPQSHRGPQPPPGPRALDHAAAGVELITQHARTSRGAARVPAAADASSPSATSRASPRRPSRRALELGERGIASRYGEGSAETSFPTHCRDSPTELLALGIGRLVGRQLVEIGVGDRSARDRDSDRRSRSARSRTATTRASRPRGCCCSRSAASWTEDVLHHVDVRGRGDAPRDERPQPWLDPRNAGRAPLDQTRRPRQRSNCRQHGTAARGDVLDRIDGVLASGGPARERALRARTGGLSTGEPIFRRSFSPTGVLASGGPARERALRARTEGSPLASRFFDGLSVALSSPSRSPLGIDGDDPKGTQDVCGGHPRGDPAHRGGRSDEGGDDERGDARRGHALLELVPERVAVCGADGRLPWANADESLLGRPLHESPAARSPISSPSSSGCRMAWRWSSTRSRLPPARDVRATAVHRSGRTCGSSSPASRTHEGTAIRACCCCSVVHHVVSDARLRSETYGAVFEEPRRSGSSTSTRGHDHGVATTPSCGLIGPSAPHPGGAAHGDAARRGRDARCTRH